MALPRFLQLVGGVFGMGVPVSSSTGAAQANSIVATGANGYLDPSLSPIDAVTGGTIDNTVIGGTTPAAGSFSSVTNASMNAANGVVIASGSGVESQAFGVSYLSNGSQGSNSNGLVVQGVGGAQLPSYFLSIVGQQFANALNTYYNGTNWVSANAGGVGAFRIAYYDAAGSGRTAWQLSLCPNATSPGAAMTTMDSTSVVAHAVTGGQMWINPQTSTPSYPANKTLILNPSGNWTVDSSGNLVCVGVTASGLITGSAGLTISSGATSVAAITASGLITGSNGLTISSGTSALKATTTTTISATGTATLPRLIQAPYSMTYGAAITCNWANGDEQKVTLTGATTITFASATAGETINLEITQDTTGSRVVTWGTTIRWQGGTAPTLTTTASKTDLITIFYDGTSYFGWSRLNF